MVLEWFSAVRVINFGAELRRRDLAEVANISVMLKLILGADSGLLQVDFQGRRFPQHEGSAFSLPKLSTTQEYKN